MADMLQPYGSTATAEEIMTDYVGRKDIEIVGIMAERDRLALPDDFMVQYVTALDAELSKSVEAIQGIDKVLEELTLPRAIVSNSHFSRIVTSLKSTGLIRFFDEKKIYSAEIAKAAKPDPAIYRFALEQIGYKAEEVLVVEDSPTGVAAAYGAGLKVIGFLAASHAMENQYQKLKENGAWLIAENSQQLNAILKEYCV